MKKFFAFALVFMLSVSWGNQAFADFATGLAAYDAKDYKTAFKQWYEAAENGDLAAQRNLGHLYRWGKGVEKNPARAAYWYYRAAEVGFDRAQFNLGMMYLNGEGVPQSYEDAYKWLKKAKKQGNQSAIKKIAELEKEKGKDFFKKDLERKEIKKENITKQQEEKAKQKAQENTIAKQEKTTKENKKIKQTKTAKKAPVFSPPKKIAEKPNVLLAHIGSYKSWKNLERGWNELVFKFPKLAGLEKVTKEVNLKNKGHYIRLYAKGKAFKVRKMCKILGRGDAYCALYKPNYKRTR